VCYEQTSLFNGFYFVAPSSFCLRLVPPTKARTHVSQPADNDRHAIHRLDTLSTPGRHPFFPPATPLKIRQRGAANSTPPRDAKTRSILGRHIPGQPWNGGSAYPASLDATTPCTNGGRPRTIQRDVSPSSIVVWAPSGTGLGSQVASPKRARDTAESSHQKRRKTPFRTICGAGHASVRPSLPRADTWPTVPRVTTTGFRRRRHPRVGPRRVVSWLCCPHRR
jgi:hypothetical protein